MVRNSIQFYYDLSPSTTMYAFDYNGKFLLFHSRWYAKRFLHPDIVAPYDYVFIWDEDLGLEHFNPEE